MDRKSAKRSEQTKQQQHQKFSADHSPTSLSHRRSRAIRPISFHRFTLANAIITRQREPDFSIERNNQRSHPQLFIAIMHSQASETNLRALNLIASKRPLVIGHRGYCQFAPENTLPSFRLAVAAGADLVELDYHHTKDGQLIVIHDPDLDRTTDAANRWRHRHVKVDSRTAAEIQSLDAGNWFDPKYAGTKVPLLSEALDTIQK